MSARDFLNPSSPVDNALDAGTPLLDGTAHAFAGTCVPDMPHTCAQSGELGGLIVFFLGVIGLLWLTLFTSRSNRG